MNTTGVERRAPAGTQSVSVFLNGTVIPQFAAGVAVNDRGFLFGDGAYEVLRAAGGQPFQWRQHLERLHASLAGLEIAGADLDSDRLLSVTQNLLRENSHDAGAATIYIQVTRGAAPRTHWYPDPPVVPTIFLSTAPFQVPLGTRERGAAAILLPDQRWARCDLKTLNLLPNSMAKQRAREAGAFEAIFHRDGVITEGANTSVFAVLDEVIHTHPLTPAILPGITRATVLDLAREEGMRTLEQAIPLDRLLHASELFLTGTTTDVQPIVRLDDRPIGAGGPGPVAKRLQERLARMMTMAPALAVPPPPDRSSAAAT